MNNKRVVILGASAVCGLASFLLIMNSRPAATPAPVVAPQAAAPAPHVTVSGPETVELLVATHDLPAGSRLAARDVRWAKAVVGAHPVDAVLRRDETQDAEVKAVVVGSILRQGLVAGETLNTKRLVKPDAGGYLAYTLGPGKRAVAVDIDVRGQRSAGNFVMPEDRVDVLVATSGSGSGSTNALAATTILRDIKVLAVGQHLSPNPDGGALLTGETVTLEVDPAQAEKITGAALGTVKLSLRPIGEKAEQMAVTNSQILTVRYGVARQQ